MEEVRIINQRKQTRFKRVHRIPSASTSLAVQARRRSAVLFGGKRRLATIDFAGDPERQKARDMRCKYDHRQFVLKATEARWIPEPCQRNQIWLVLAHDLSVLATDM